LNKKNVVITCDDSYMYQASTMLNSLLKNNNSDIKIFLIHNGVKKKKLDSLKKLVNQFSVEFEDFKIKNNFFSDLKTTHHFKNVNYFRLLIPDVLPRNINKVLYLDCDILVLNSIEFLWEINLNNHFLAAVKDNVSITHKEQLGMKPTSNYFNSGVMLINLDFWRQEQLSKKVIEFVIDHPEKIEFVDQDGLNAIINGHWIELPLSWNVQSYLFMDNGLKIRYADILSEPSVIHFSGNGLKPWKNNNFTNLYFSEYKKYQKSLSIPKSKFKLISKQQLTLHSKKYLKKIFFFFGKINLLWKINSYFFRISKFIYDSRNLKTSSNFSQKDIEQELIKSIISEKKVVAGPFKGLIYPNIEAIGSSIYPKLLGTYEIELEHVINEICSNKYSVIIDIGCAEGYYAVGLAMLNDKSKVYAYDNNKYARDLCISMAKENNVSERVIVNEIFTMRTIHKILPKDQGFIICDCEGAEEYIFYDDGENWLELIKHFDLLIEIHDVFRQGISQYIYQLFSKYYEIQIIYSVEDNLRAVIFDTPLLNGIDYCTKLNFLAENRPGIMQWFYMKRKNIS